MEIDCCLGSFLFKISEIMAFWKQNTLIFWLLKIGLKLWVYSRVAKPCGAAFRGAAAFLGFFFAAKITESGLKLFDPPLTLGSTFWAALGSTFKKTSKKRSKRCRVFSWIQPILAHFPVFFGCFLPVSAVFDQIMMIQTVSILGSFRRFWALLGSTSKHGLDYVSFSVVW